jgi:cysteine desulfurase
VFTSGGTEANNTAFHSARQTFPERRHVVTTAVEHSAVLRVAESLGSRGYRVTAVGVDANGEVDLDEVRDALSDDTALLSAMWANNETGIVFPVEQMAQIARDRGVLFHTDAVQAAGKVPIALRDSAISMLSIAGHKIYGPKGIGALYVSKRVRFRPLLIGGSHENSRRAGTENVPGVIGLGKAAEMAADMIEEERTRLAPMRDAFEAAMLERVNDVRVNGAQAQRLPNTSNLLFGGVDSGSALLMLDQQKVCCSAGSACKTGSLDASHVLRALGLANDVARGALRFSFGRFNTPADVERAVDVVPKVIGKLRGISRPVSAL